MALPLAQCKRRHEKNQGIYERGYVGQLRHAERSFMAWSMSEVDLRSRREACQRLGIGEGICPQVRAAGQVSLSLC